MSTATINLIHETETQRRHARVKLPVRLTIKDKEGALHTFSIADISASGFSIDIKTNELISGYLYQGVLLFKINTVEFRVPIAFTVKYLSEENDKAGCEFNSLGEEENSLIRMFISKYLAGDLASNADILTTMSRDNYTKERKNGSSGALSGLRKFRALVVTGLVACVGLSAFSYIVLNLYQHYFITYSVSAMVDIDKEPVIAPTSGYYELVADINTPVGKGVPLAVITSSVYEAINSVNNTQFTSEELKDILPTELNSLIKNPCNCLIISASKNDREFTQQGDVLFQVADVNASPYVTAYFNFTDVEIVTINKTVNLSIPGDKTHYTGKIEDVALSDDPKRPNAIIAIIRPDQVIDIENMSHPVQVSIGNNFEFGDIDFSSILR
ncbi:PilZ domain-containing protein [Moritella sp. Urea-trap-13]|uniref:PilZ domain-containing protein n=1 Tax=Moritella sp. Urea-trap-13 TaxID=2058327 RepID=UPI000C326382|nr:PilZ domain-containing protein [Moritella sp. Urea-trap-13]PKH07920.1 hypothetical protein CXF93_04310 [Moritella sp. Urea-trap-13]